MSRLPLSVIGGYLGAGKTTLINRLLGADHGLRIAVMVNDFGAINIDAALLKSASTDTIELTNGCVCCAMTGDLFFAIGDMLDRRPRPDHLVIEASGIADPAKIAAVAQTEPELLYGGILTLVDGLNFTGHLQEERIAEQLRAQVRCADFIAVTKTSDPDTATVDALHALGAQHWHDAADAHAIVNLLEARPNAIHQSSMPAAHPDYVRCAIKDPPALSKKELACRLGQSPQGILRLKGILPAERGKFWEVHLVGRNYDIAFRESADLTGLVVIGLDGLVTPEMIKRWWAGRTDSPRGIRSKTEI